MRNCMAAVGPVIATQGGQLFAAASGRVTRSFMRSAVGSGTEPVVSSRHGGGMARVLAASQTRSPSMSAKNTALTVVAGVLLLAGPKAHAGRFRATIAASNRTPKPAQLAQLALRNARREFRALLGREPKLRDEYHAKLVEAVIRVPMAIALGMGGVGVALHATAWAAALVMGEPSPMPWHEVAATAGQGLVMGGLGGAWLGALGPKDVRTATVKSALQQGKLERDVAARWTRVGLIHDDERKDMIDHVKSYLSPTEDSP